MVQYLKYSCFVAVLLFSKATYAQLAIDTNELPEIELPFPLEDESFSPVQSPNEGGLYLNTPSNIKSSTEFDENTGQYIVTQKVGNSMDYRRPVSMSLDEYLDYDMSKSLDDFWKQKKAEELEAKKEEKGFRPQIKLNNEVFDRIFGSDVIDIKPQGSIEVILGLQSSKTENPAIPLKQQRLTTFLFDQKIQFNLLGSIGDKMKLNLNFNTEAMFNFENLTKLTYTGQEDDIIQLIELGNVSMPLRSSLITGSQTLFGVKTGLKFGKLNVTTILSQQQGKKDEIEIKNGSQVKEFEVKADEYEFNKHFFLDHFFRDKYEQAVANPPLINSEFYITKIEVYKTPRNVFDNTRNIIAFQDLGTAITDRLLNSSINDNSTSDIPQSNANSLYGQVSNNPAVRGFSGAVGVLKGLGLEDRRDFLTISQAEILQEGQHYTLNRQLGYISLNNEMPVDQALAVAFQFTYRGKTYQVGEFSTDGIAGEQALILKMIKSVELDFNAPMWDLMMKNIYSLGNAYQVKKEGFRLDVWYLDATTGVEINYLPEGSVKDRALIQVMGLDKLTVNNQRVETGDGVFDFLSDPPITIMPERARVIFPKLEPFGDGLKDAFLSGEESLANKFAFDSLYTTTKSLARVNYPQKNRFYIKGEYQSDVSSEFSLGAFNLPEGSVSVTQGGNLLTENADYTVDYNLGRVKIINPSILEAAAPIKIAFESNSLFAVQQKSLIGARFDYEVNKNLQLGGTLMRLSERPITQKVNAGNEPINNTMLGVDVAYNDQSQFLTDLIDKMPFLSSKGKSRINFTGEYAKLFPGHSKAIGKDGTSYLDDFEGSLSTIELRSQATWQLASTPQGQPGLFPEGETSSNLANGYGRAKLAWYTIDPSIFYRTNNLTPEGITDPEIQSNHFMRQVYETEVFPNKDLAATQQQQVAMFDLAFYPNERGPYNYDVDGRDTSGVQYSAGINDDGSLKNPEERWGGIMREINTNDFDASNVEYIQFWLMDPYAEAGTPGFPDAATNGKLYFNIGNISEDILRDDQRFFENGLGTTQQESQDLTDDTLSPWGRVIPNSVPYLLDAFDNNPETREYQDVGLDGLANQQEATFFQQEYLDRIEALYGTNSVAYTQALQDISADDYHYFLGDDYDQQNLDILERYKNYNGLEGNSPTSEQYSELNADGYPTTASTLPNSEDVNNDKTINYGESYYQYEVDISSGSINPGAVGDNYISSVYNAPVETPSGSKPVNWYQFRIPVRDKDRKAIGDIQGLNSVRFMRMFVKGFKDPVFLRFARLELVTGQWRKYDGDNKAAGEYVSEDQFSSFDIGAVNIEENASKTPVNYVLPPDIDRQVDLTTINQQRQNEQALQLKTCDLPDGAFQAAYRNFDYDVRMYNRLQLYTHGEAVEGESLLQDDELKVFIRLGTDFENNYYEYELPLKVTAPGFYNPEDENAQRQVWPTLNNIDIEFSKLQAIKTQRNVEIQNNAALFQKAYSRPDPNYPDNNIIIVGNPNLSTVKTVMVGIKNPKDDNVSKCVEVWFNELRLTDFDNDGGWAAIGRLVTDMPGLGTLSVAGSMSTPGFGSIDKRVAERQLETIQQFDISFETDLGQFLPKPIGLSAPMYLGYSKGVITPRFNPLDPDVELDVLTNSPIADDAYVDSLLSIVRDQTVQKSFNLTNVKRQRTGSAKPRFFDISNFTASYAFTETFRSNFTINKDLTVTHQANLTYSFNPKPINFEPFKNAKFLKSKYLKLIKDMNLFLGPKSYGFSTDIDRFYNERITRNTNPGIRAEIPPFYNKNFNWFRRYNLAYDITNNLKFDFNATNTALIEEPYGKVDRKEDPDGFKLWKDSVFSNISKGGTNTDYRHQSNLNWTVPLNKFPLTNWMSATARYSSSYNWQRAPFAADSLGHTIQNSNSYQVNTNLNFLNLYNKVPYLKKVKQKFRKAERDKKKKKKTVLDNKIKKVIESTIEDSTKTKKEIRKEEKEKDEDKITAVDRVAKFLMGFKNASVTYNQDNGLLLPGIKNKTSLMGMDNRFNSPGVPFIFGLQDVVGAAKDEDFAPYAASQGWLVQGVNIPTQHTTTKTEQLNFRGSIEPIKDLRIDLTANSTFGFNTNEFFNWNDSIGGFQQQSYIETGNFSRSYMTLGTAFAKIDSSYNSQINSAFLVNREVISSRLAAEREGYSPSYDPNSGVLSSDPNYQAGYDESNQEVLIPAFLAAYSKKDPNEVKLNPLRSLPSINWRMNYTGLKKLKFFKDKVRNITISHGYKSSLTFGSYTSNILFTENQEEGPNGTVYTDSTDFSNNFIPRYQINTVVISEQLSPLIKVDITFKTKNNLQARFEIKKDRTITLSIPNTQVTEINGLEFVIGSGYVLPKVKFPFKLPGERKRVTSSLNLRADFSLRNNRTILRKIIEGENIASAGQKVYSLKTAADYQLTSKINVRYFFDWLSTTPFISTSFPTSNLRSGFSVRFTL